MHTIIVASADHAIASAIRSATAQIVKPVTIITTNTISSTISKLHRKPKAAVISGRALSDGDWQDLHEEILSGYPLTPFALTVSGQEYSDGAIALSEKAVPVIPKHNLIPGVQRLITSDSSNLRISNTFGGQYQKERKLKSIQQAVEILDGMGNLGYWTVDLETAELFWSDLIYEMFDVPKHLPPLDIRTQESLLNQSDKEKALYGQAMLDAISYGAPWEMLVYMRIKGGHSFTVYSTGKVVTGELGTPLFITGVLQFLSDKQMRFGQRESDYSGRFIDTFWEPHRDRLYLQRNYSTINSERINEIVIYSSDEGAREVIQNAIPSSNLKVNLLEDDELPSLPTNDKRIILYVFGDLDEINDAGVRQAISFYPREKKVAIFFEHPAYSMRQGLYKMGIRGLLNFKEDSHKLFAALNAVAADQLWFSHNRPIAQRSGSNDLTDREIEVINLLALGLTNKDISQILRISYRTVTNHLYSIFKKLGVADRYDAVAHYFDL